MAVHETYGAMSWMRYWPLEQFFVVGLEKLLNKELNRQWFEAPGHTDNFVCNILIKSIDIFHDAQRVIAMPSILKLLKTNLLRTSRVNNYIESATLVISWMAYVWLVLAYVILVISATLPCLNMTAWLHTASDYGDWTNPIVYNYLWAKSWYLVGFFFT